MKNTARIPRNAGTKPAAVQVEMIEPKRKYLLQLVEKSEDKSTVIESLEMSDAVFEEVERWRELRIINKLLPTAIRRFMWKSNEMEQAVFQSNALVALFYEHIEGDREGSLFNTRTDAGGIALCGLQNLVWSTQDRLTKSIADF